MLTRQVEPLTAPGTWAARYMQGDKVHSDIFTDPEIFRREMEKIFSATWVYVAHESEMQNKGDFVVRKIGEQPVVAVHGNDGIFRIVMNRCRHRGAVVCEVPKGNQSHFRCFYHGWTYENTGKLVHIPKDDGYPPDFDFEGHSLSQVPRVESYRGFLFGSLSTNVPSLREHLGYAADKLDFMIDASPTGKIYLDAGVERTVFRGNWKFVGMDGYHPPIVHHSAFEIIKRSQARAMGEDSAVTQVQRKTMGESELAVSRDLGHGHAMLDVVPHRISEAAHHLAAARRMKGGPEYVESMFAAYGEQRGTELLAVGGDPHLGLFPNAQMINQHVRMVVPLAHDRTEVVLFPVRLGDVNDDVNEVRLRRHEDFYGPAGFGQPDDSEIFERAAEGLKARIDPWVDISRGAHRERIDVDGTIIGHVTDEVPTRAQMREWARLMNA